LYIRQPPLEPWVFIIFILHGTGVAREVASVAARGYEKAGSAPFLVRRCLVFN
jgi:hypothetical protein